MWPNQQEPWSDLLKKTLLENFIFCGVEDEGDLFRRPVII